MPTSYRYHTEDIILTITLLAIGFVVLFITGATFFTGLFFVTVLMGFSIFQIYQQHNALRKQPYPLSLKTLNQMTVLLEESRAAMGMDRVELLVAKSDVLNAYAFGLLPPRTIVLHSALVEAMDAEELHFIIGHELGHIHLGHTTLNTIVGGLAGTPGNVWVSMLLRTILRAWSRACEYSADRAGLLACGNPEKAVTALLKTAAGGKAQTTSDLAATYRKLQAQDGSFGSELSEMLSTHPQTFNRIQQIQKWAQSKTYRKLRDQMTAKKEWSAQA
jgi:Zn-dependent protease with chaperone function